MAKRWAAVGAGAVIVAAVAAWAVAYGATTGSGQSPAISGWAGSVSALVFDLAAATTIGLLVLASFALDPTRDEFPRALDTAAVSAGVMTIFAAASGFLSTQSAQSAAWLVTALIAAVITALCFLIRSLGGAAFLVILAIASLWPVADAEAAGLAPGGAESLMLHVVFASVWLGGLAALVFLRPRLGESRWRVVATRFRPLADVSFIVVALSGASEAVYRLGSSPDLGADYGVLLLSKVVILVAAAVVLLVIRSRNHAPTLPRLLALELGFLAIAFGVSAVLPSRQAPIARAVPAKATPAEILTSHPLPPPFGFANLLGEWRLDLGWALAFAFAAVLYVVGVRHLRHRGHHWPVGRTILWFAGLALAAWLTSGGPAVYRNTLFSVDVAVGLAWSLVVPLLLVQGAPLRLACRTLHTRTDGSRGAREWLRAFSRSRIVRFFAHPATAAVVFAGSVWAFSVGPLLRWSTVNSFGHGWAALQLLAAGLLLVHALTARTARLRTGWRLLLLAGVTAALVATGLWAASTDELLLADWFGAMGRTWGAPPSVDQVAGGTVFWIGSIVVAAVLSAIIVARRRDSRTSRASAARPSRRVL